MSEGIEMNRASLLAQVRRRFGKGPEEDMAAQKVVEVKLARAKAGWSRREWHPNARSPLAQRDDNGYYNFVCRVDHAYRLVRGAEVLYIFEPYDLDDDIIGELAKLPAAGWEVWINANIAMHYPGKTMCVSISRRSGPCPDDSCI